LQGSIGSRALGLYHPLVRHRPGHDLESFLWIFLQMLVQYSPSAVIDRLPSDESIAFKGAQRAALVAFDDATPLENSFQVKRKLISEQLISSTVEPLSYALLQLLDSMGHWVKALGQVQWNQNTVANAAKHGVRVQKVYQDQLIGARADAVKKRLSYSEVLAIFTEALASVGWPDKDAALLFGPMPQCGSSSVVAEGHRAGAQRSAYMSSIKRAYSQLNEEGEAAAEGSSASKKRKKESDGEQGRVGLL
jgi:hypothetical protein